MKKRKHSGEDRQPRHKNGEAGQNHEDHAHDEEENLHRDDGKGFWIPVVGITLQEHIGNDLDWPGSEDAECSD